MVFPLVPVTAITGRLTCREAHSISPTISVPRAARLLQGFDFQWNPGADYYEVFIQKIFEPVGSQPKRAARLLDGIQRAVEFSAGAQVRRAHFRPPASEQSAYGPA